MLNRSTGSVWSARLPFWSTPKHQRPQQLGPIGNNYTKFNSKDGSREQDTHFSACLAHSQISEAIKREEQTSPGGTIKNYRKRRFFGETVILDSFKPTTKKPSSFGDDRVKLVDSKLGEIGRYISYDDDDCAKQNLGRRPLPLRYAQEAEASWKVPLFLFRDCIVCIAWSFILLAVCCIE